MNNLRQFLYLDLFPLSTPTILQTQSQPSTMLTNHQQMLQNPLLLTPTPQSFSYSTITPSPNLINTALSTESLKHQLIPPLPTSSSSITTEPIENSQVVISPSNVNETSIPSDSTTQQPVNKNNFLF